MNHLIAERPHLAHRKHLVNMSYDYFGVVPSWPSHLTSLSLNFFSCK